MKPKMTTPRRAGFTLIELLVAVAIIATLIGIAVPSFSAARRRAYLTTCQTRLREISQALWEYSVSNDSRVPFVISPMTNGGLVPGFGSDQYPDEEIDPFDRERWPSSLQNILMPLYLGRGKKVFTCPVAVRGWPRGGGFEMSYRDAGANQPNGLVSAEGSYFRESFGFLDGRPMNEMRFKFSGDPLRDAQTYGASRGTYMRDMVIREEDKVFGPHDGGINVINREFGVEFRDWEATQADLAPFGAGVRF